MAGHYREKRGTGDVKLMDYFWRGMLWRLQIYGGSLLSSVLYIELSTHPTQHDVGNLDPSLPL